MGPKKKKLDFEQAEILREKGRARAKKSYNRKKNKRLANEQETKANEKSLRNICPLSVTFNDHLNQRHPPTVAERIVRASRNGQFKLAKTLLASLLDNPELLGKDTIEPECLAKLAFSFVAAPSLSKAKSSDLKNQLEEVLGKPLEASK